MLQIMTDNDDSDGGVFGKYLKEIKKGNFVFVSGYESLQIIPESVKEQYVEFFWIMFRRNRGEDD